MQTGISAAPKIPAGSKSIFASRPTRLNIARRKTSRRLPSSLAREQDNQRSWLFSRIKTEKTPNHINLDVEHRRAGLRLHAAPFGLQKQSRDRRLHDDLGDEGARTQSVEIDRR